MIAPRIDSSMRTSGRSNVTARFMERRGSNRGRKGDESPRGQDPGGEQSSSGRSEELDMGRKSSRRNRRSSTGVKLGNYDGNTCLQTFLARFETYAEYFEWNEADKLF